MTKLTRRDRPSGYEAVLLRADTSAILRASRRARLGSGSHIVRCMVPAALQPVPTALQLHAGGPHAITHAVQTDLCLPHNGMRQDRTKFHAKPPAYFG